MVNTAPLRKPLRRRPPPQRRGRCLSSIHMPNPSYFPLLSAIGFFIIGLGMLLDNPTLTIGLLNLPVMVAVGGLIMVAAIYAWAFEPAG